MKRKDAPQDLRNKSLLLSASIIDMVHGTKQKWITTCKGNPFIREDNEKFLAICQAQGGFREPEYAIYKEDVIAEKSVLLLKLTTEDWRNCKTRWRPHDSKAGVAKTPLNTQVQKEIYCILYLKQKAS
jgi:thymidine phosphorylase